MSVKNTRLNTDSNRHMMDILFVLSLFCVFAVSSVILILFGANVYQRTITQMDENYSTRTSVAYITEKIRQSDAYDSVYIENVSGKDVLMMTQTINNLEYATSLYEYDGYLYELFARTDIDLPIDAGQPVIELCDLHFRKIADNLLEITFTDTSVKDENNNIIPHENIIYVSLHCNNR